MEPECLEPLNLVIKKDSTTSEIPDKNTTPEDQINKDKLDLKIQEDMTVLQDAVKSVESGVPPADQKFLTALYMSSLMQMSNASSLRSISPSPYNVQQNFMQLLAMIEARHRMWQQLSWSVPPNFLRNPIGLPSPYYDGSLTNINDQLCNSPNSLLTYPMPSTKHEQPNHDSKQTSFKRYTFTTDLPFECSQLILLNYFLGLQ